MTQAKRTPWFSYIFDNSPTYRGWYECNCGRRHYWDGTNWYQNTKGLKNRLVVNSAFTSLRGLTEKQ